MSQKGIVELVPTLLYPVIGMTKLTQIIADLDLAGTTWRQEWANLKEIHLFYCNRARHLNYAFFNKKEILYHLVQSVATPSAASYTQLYVFLQTISSLCNELFVTYYCVAHYSTFNFSTDDFFLF